MNHVINHINNWRIRRQVQQLDVNFSSVSQAFAISLSKLVLLAHASGMTESELGSSVCHTAQLLALTTQILHCIAYLLVLSHIHLPCVTACLDGPTYMHATSRCCYLNACWYS
jgi:hypothetical protein